MVSFYQVDDSHPPFFVSLPHPPKFSLWYKKTKSINTKLENTFTSPGGAKVNFIQGLIKHGKKILFTNTDCFHDFEN